MSKAVAIAIVVVIGLVLVVLGITAAWMVHSVFTGNDDEHGDW